MLEVHPLAERIPAMTEEEYTQLVEDIGAHGLLDPITMYQGCILDGRHRYRALHELKERGTGVDFPEPLFVDFDGDDEGAWQLVLSKNLYRRHLEYGQRAALAVYRKRELQDSGEVKHGGDRSKTPISASCTGEAAEIAAREFRVGKTAVKEAEAILEEAPELFEVMKDGGIGLRDAQKTISERKQEAHREALREPPTPTSKYRVIYADPPWQYGDDRAGLRDYSAAADHYSTMSIKQLCDLPVREWIEPDAVLFLWVTSPLLAECWPVIKAWGFEYKASFVWDKVKHNYGHYNSVRHELLLICTRGSYQPEDKELLDSVVQAERGEHSAKPEVFREIIDKLYPSGKRLEMFARSEHETWDTWGNEANGDNRVS